MRVNFGSKTQNDVKYAALSRNRREFLPNAKVNELDAGILSGYTMDYTVIYAK